MILAFLLFIEISCSLLLPSLLELLYYPSTLLSLLIHNVTLYISVRSPCTFVLFAVHSHLLIQNHPSHFLSALICSFSLHCASSQPCTIYAALTSLIPSYSFPHLSTYSLPCHALYVTHHRSTTSLLPLNGLAWEPWEVEEHSLQECLFITCVSPAQVPWRHY